jgi:hypothetical protein
MNRFRSWAARGAVALLALSAGATDGPVPAQAPSPPAPRFKSVYGKLEIVNKQQSGVIMVSDDGERLAWKFNKPVIEEASRFETGARVIVIYRQTRPNEKLVTALAFPGTASVPTYVNTTGARVVLRSGPKVDGACGLPGAEPIHDSGILAGGLTEISDACWCCAPSGETCTPANESGVGRALLVKCFK